MVDTIVKLQSGLVRGTVEKHEDGFNYYSFKGIPYAEPPIGVLRFEDPVPKKKWEVIMDCKTYGRPCLQDNIFNSESNYNEDCLFLNVFTQTINDSNKNNPVIVFVHGGGFTFGAGDDLLYGPEHLIRKNVVLLTFNYRLGVLGFLNLEDEIAPGNQGFKDQVMVLQWVQQNIRGFGGNPNNVTVFGYSSGGASAHFLSLSPLTKGLVHKVISQACLLYNPWVNNADPKSNAIKLCSLLGQNLIEAQDILKFLKTVDAKQLLEAQVLLQKTLGCWPFGPGDDSKSRNPFMPMHPQLAADQGVHLPYLAGWNDREGLVTLHGMTKENFLKTTNLNFASVFKFNSKRVLERYNLNAAQIRKFYFGSETISEKNIDKFVDFASDFFFIEPVHRFAKVQAERSSAPTYLYQFTYDHPDSFMKAWVKDLPRGACHLDDLCYLFKMRCFDNFGLEQFKKGTQTYKLMEQMTEMWTNFARYGKPTVEKSQLIPVHWKPLAGGTFLRFLNIDEDITMKFTVNVDQKLSSIKCIKA